MRGINESRFENWIFNSFRVTPGGLGLYRIFTALFLLFFILPPRGLYMFMSHLPAGFYDPPPGLMQLFSSFPPAYIFSILDGILILSIVFLGLGFKTKWSSILCGLTLLLLKGFSFSMGKINHEMLLIITPLVMAFSGWGKAYSVDAWRKGSTNDTINSWPLTLFALIMGFMFFTAGLPKILGGWLNLNTHAAYSHYLKEYLVRNRRDFLAPFAWTWGHAIWQVGDYLTVFFEVGFLAAIFHPKSTRIFICLAVLFHLSTMLIMNISFLPNFIAYAAFINWTRVDALIRSRLSRSTKQRIRGWQGPSLVAGALTVVFLLSRALSGWDVLASDWGMAGFMIVLSAVPIALFYLVKQVLGVLK